MPEYSLIKDGKVVNRIVADSKYVAKIEADYDYITDSPEAKMGASWDGKDFTPAPVPAGKASPKEQTEDTLIRVLADLAEIKAKTDNPLAAKYPQDVLAELDKAKTVPELISVLKKLL